MTPAEFASRLVGTPWVKWRGDFEAADCFGVVSLYFREVRGVDLGTRRNIGGEHGFTEWADWQRQFTECDLQDGAAFMAWRDGEPVHCGILLDARRVLHSQGSEDRGGAVCVSRLDAMRRLFPELRFYRHASMQGATPC